MYFQVRIDSLLCGHERYAAKKASSFTDLGTLKLFGGRYVVPQPFVLEELYTLEFSEVSVVAQLLDPIYLPSLTSLSLSSNETRDDFDRLSYTRLVDLAPQLDKPEWADVNLIDRTPTILRSIFYNTLFEYNWYIPAFSASWIQVPHQLRLRDLNEASDTSDIERLKPLTSTLNTSITNLRTLYLDITMEEPCLTDEGWEYWDAFADALNAKGIQIIYED